MNNKITALFLLTLFLCTPLATASAAVETSIVTTVKSGAKPVATTVSADGRWLYVLTGQRTVEVYETSGSLRDTIKLASQADDIAVSPNGDMLFLTDKKAGTIAVVAVSFVQTIDTTGAPYRGAEKAPVVISVFSDFQCPYCARVSSLMDQVLAEYPKEVKVVHKSFPLQSHQMANPAAVAALAAHRQGKFWEMHNMIFENYSSLTEERFTEFAKSLGLNLEQFAKDRMDPEIQDRVQRDLQNGIAAEVRGTPTIFVNGRRLNERSLEGIKALVEAELRKVK